MIPFTAKETRILDNLFTYTNCKTARDVRRYIDKAYDKGMTIDDLYTYFVTYAPTCI